MITLKKQHRRYEPKWKSQSLKRICTFKYGKALADEDRTDGPVPVFGSNGAVGGHDKALTKGETIIIGRKGSSGKIQFSEKSCFPIDTTFFIDRSSTRQNIKWLYYVLGELKLEEQRKDSAVPGLSREDVYPLRILLPEIEEQSSIASYLDEKTALLDRIIAEKQHQISLLQEQRAAIIHRAVTKGLGKNVEMKESVVEWIGKIPMNWLVKKLKSAFAFEKGKQAGLFTKEYIGDPKNIGDYPVYSGQTEDEGVMGRINTYIYDLDDTIFTTTVGAKVMTPMIIGGKFSLSQNCVLFIKRSKTIDVRYFFYQLVPMFQWEKDSIPSHMQPSLRVSDLNKYSMAFPPYDEQIRIAKFIDEKTNFIDGLSKKIEHSISLLNEYKTSLISHVVTGKIQIPSNYDH